MEQKPSLEERLSESNPNNSPTEPSWLRKMVVHGSANALFYTPIMMGTEYLSLEQTNKFERMLESRSIGVLVALSTGYLYSLSQKEWAKRFGADTKSSGLKKGLVDTITGVAAMIPYALLLNVVGTSTEEKYKALALGFAVGALTGGVYGRFLSYWTKRWGLEPFL